MSQELLFTMLETERDRALMAQDEAYKAEVKYKKAHENDASPTEWIGCVFFFLLIAGLVGLWIWGYRLMNENNARREKAVSAAWSFKVPSAEG